jgi:GNAT superfamily N-acetyltransferase
VTVRALREDDRAAWQPLWDGYLVFYETELDPAVTDDTFSRLVQERDGLFGLVAEVDGEVRGFAHVVVHPSTWTSDRYVYLEDLFVAEPARGQGLARALIAAVYQRAENRKVYWQTAQDNPARALYDQVADHLGFVVYERP